MRELVNNINLISLIKLNKDHKNNFKVLQICFNNFNKIIKMTAKASL